MQDRPDKSLPFRLRFKTHSAPYLEKAKVVGALKTFVIKDAILLGEIRLANEDWVNAFTAHVDIGADHLIEIGDRNEIKMELFGVTAEARVISSMTDIITGSLIDSLIIRYMPLIIPEVAQTISVISIPSFLGFTIDIKDMWVEDIDNQHLSSVGDFIRID